MAYQIAPAALIGTFDYTYVVFAVVWGYVLFAERPDAAAVVGLALIAAAGVLVAGRPAGGCAAGDRGVGGRSKGRPDDGRNGRDRPQAGGRATRSSSTAPRAPSCRSVARRWTTTPGAPWPPPRHPDLLRAIHEDYIRAGADIVTANTFASARHLLERAGIGERTAELQRLAVRLAREAVPGPGTRSGARWPWPARCRPCGR